VLVSSIEDARRLPGFEPIRGDPVEPPDQIPTFAFDTPEQGFDEGAVDTLSHRAAMSPDPIALVVDGREIREERKKPRKRRAPKSVEQRPAAYRFTSTDGRIGVLPEPPEPLDRLLAVDTQQELLRKARQLLVRLRGSNSAQRVCDSVQGLLGALDVSFDELRPGLLLSRVRSLEADGSAFDTEDARAELFPDAFAGVADVVQTARDLLGVFPEVRRIEVERLALDLHR
jgi:hypothetical protein